MTAWRQHAACRGTDPNIFHPAGSDGYELANAARSATGPTPPRSPVEA
jgi:hypothetical protein